MRKAAAFALAFLAACSSTTPTTRTAPTRTTPSGITKRPHTTPTHDVPGAPSVAPPGDPGSLAARFHDHGGVGTSGPAYIRSSPATKLIVEIDYVKARSPAASATQHLSDVLSRELDKPGGITVDLSDEIPASKTAYTLQDIVHLEARYRNHYSGGDTATMWFVYLNGQLSDEDGTLGISYEATSAAIFIDTVRNSGTVLVSPDSIERSTITHEAGHLLGLVNLIVKSAFDHEDPNHRGHSRYETSVMYWAVEDTSVASLLNGGPPDDFDKYDRADISAIRKS